MVSAQIQWYSGGMHGSQASKSGRQRVGVPNITRSKGMHTVMMKALSTSDPKLYKSGSAHVHVQRSTFSMMRRHSPVAKLRAVSPRYTMSTESMSGNAPPQSFVRASMCVQIINTHAHSHERPNVGRLSVEIQARPNV
jgi:hypothetical protein